MKNEKIKDEGYQKLLEDVSTIIKEGRKRMTDVLGNFPDEVKDDFLPIKNRKK